MGRLPRSRPRLRPSWRLAWAVSRPLDCTPASMRFARPAMGLRPAGRFPLSPLRSRFSGRSTLEPSSYCRSNRRAGEGPLPSMLKLSGTPRASSRAASSSARARSGRPWKRSIVARNSSTKSRISTTLLPSTGMSCCRKPKPCRPASISTVRSSRASTWPISSEARSASLSKFVRVTSNVSVVTWKLESNIAGQAMSMAGVAPTRPERLSVSSERSTGRCRLAEASAMVRLTIEPMLRRLAGAGRARRRPPAQPRR